MLLEGSGQKVGIVLPLKRIALDRSSIDFFYKKANAMHLICIFTCVIYRDDELGYN